MKLTNMIAGMMITLTALAATAHAESTTSTTIADTTPPGQPTLFAAKRDIKTIIFSWVNPTDDDFHDVVLTLQNKEVVTLRDGETSYVYTPATFAGVQTFTIAAEDTNGNRSEPVVLNWDSPNRAPVEAKNITYKDVAGLITVSFTPANEYDYSYTFVTLPNGRTTMVPKGRTSFTYNAPTSIGTAYHFTFQSVDTVGNMSKGVTSTFTPKAVVVNKTMTAKISFKIRATPTSTGTPVHSVAAGYKVTVFSKGYGVKRDYAYVQSGTKKGYVLTSSLK